MCTCRRSGVGSYDVYYNNNFKSLAFLGGNMKDIRTRILETITDVPSKIAIQNTSQSMTYSDMYKRICYLSQQIKELYPNGIYGRFCLISTKSAVNAIIAQLTVLLNGGICVPLNSSTSMEYYSIKRFGNIACIIYDGLDKNFSKEIPILHINTTENGYSKEATCFCEYVDMDRPVYCIMTSGTTGISKAIMLTQIAILNQVDAKISILQMNKTSKVCIGTDNSFVATIWQILATVFVGGTIIALEDFEKGNPLDLLKKASEYEASILCTVPSVLGAFLASNERKKAVTLPEKFTIVSTGELLRADLARRLKESYNIKLINAYGQSECSDDVFHFVVPDEYDYSQSCFIPIGYPIPNVKYMIIDEQGELVEEKEQGELCISGPCLSLGYLFNSEETNSRFKNVGIFLNERFFFTGDIVSQNEDGTLICYGRKDNQIKINGYRVEPEHIEACCQLYSGVLDAVALKVTSQNSEYIHLLYVSEENFNVGELDLRRFLTKMLPQYMVPAIITKTKQIKYNSNGKKIRAFDDIEENNDLVEASDTHFSELTQDALISLMSKSTIRTMKRYIDFNKSVNTPLNELINSLEFIYLIIELEEILDIEFDVNEFVINAFPTVGSFADRVLLRYNRRNKQQ